VQKRTICFLLLRGGFFLCVVTFCGFFFLFSNFHSLAIWANADLMLLMWNVMVSEEKEDL
jgi:hypothetical protein